jgi:hypothetical protein
VAGLVLLDSGHHDYAERPRAHPEWMRAAIAAVGVDVLLLLATEPTRAGNEWVSRLRP